MVRVSAVGPEARSRVIPRGAAGQAYQLRAPIREAITKLRGEEAVELTPDADETLRQVKVIARRAAKDVGREIQYGETEENTLLVWLAEPTRRRRRRRGAEQAEEADVLAAQEEMLP
jgi:hypothetical protein